MVAAALGLLVVLIAISMLLSSNRAWLAQVQAASVDDAARFALASIERAARQGAYVEWERGDAASRPRSPARRQRCAGSMPPRCRSTAHALTDPRPASVNGSDVLALRFSGAGEGGGDGSVATCAASPWGPGRKAGAFSMSA
ncbi:hypothetical protein LP420_06650 [Massilia sp. B-10]|nr:hypothetical protein LP420_06650 [Massilia sp. B-10]